VENIGLNTPILKNMDGVW